MCHTNHEQSHQIPDVIPNQKEETNMKSEGPFCQSCAMPLTEPEHFGTEADGSRSEKYCAHCYEDGQFTLPDATLEEMIEISAREWSDQDRSISFEQAKSRMTRTLPALERWRE
jgi:hypothetical protein